MVKALSRNTILRRRRAFWEQIEKLNGQISEIESKILALRKLCPHEKIESYCNYEDSGWSCPDCGGDWRNHPHKDEK